MPRCVRPFWVDLSVDGRNDIGTGPRDNAGGTMQLTLFTRAKTAR